LESLSINPQSAIRNPQFDIGFGSNNWVISGTRTTTGQPILANDPHLGVTLPPIWYSIHLSCPPLNVAGVTFPGVPGVVLGHNGWIAWGATNVFPDVQDLFVEEFNPDDPTEYIVDGGRRRAKIISEVIRVRESALSTATREVRHQVMVTHHGPIVAERDGKKYALQWTALDDASEFAAFFKINTATNWQDFQTALRLFPGPAQNFVYADIKGNIGYIAAGRIPLRKSGDGSVPARGSSTDAEWAGFVPFAELPQVYNPPEGFIATANQRIVGGSYPYHITHQWYPPYRAARINELIRRRPKLSVEDVRAIQADLFSRPDHLFAQQVFQFAKAHSEVNGQDRELWSEIYGALLDWDGVLDPNSRAAALVTTMRTIFGEKVLRAKLGQWYDDYRWTNRSLVTDWVIRQRPKEWLPSGHDSYDALLLDCYRETLSQFKEQLGESRGTWRYGRINTLVFTHPLSRIPGLGLLFTSPTLEMGGSGNTVNAYVKRSQYLVSMRIIADLSDWDKTLHHLTLGQSGQHTSPYHVDQLDDWESVRLSPFPFTQEAVLKHTRHTLKLIPLE
jgi:penicillin amidase